VRIDAKGRLRFPDVPTLPGLYRFWIETADRRPGVYIGEGSDLRRRLQHYPTPGAKQPTNLRMNQSLPEALGADSRVTLWVAIDVTVAFGAAQPMELDLSRKSQRLIAEQAAIIELLLADLTDTESDLPVRARLLNKPGVGESPESRTPRLASLTLGAPAGRARRLLGSTPARPIVAQRGSQA
jgi:hypothetical protein